MESDNVAADKSCGTLDITRYLPVYYRNKPKWRNGRRAWFRSMSSQGGEGSTPFFGTIYLPRTQSVRGFSLVPESVERLRREYPV